jgi:hypothetical protein
MSLPYTFKNIKLDVYLIHSFLMFSSSPHPSHHEHGHTYDSANSPYFEPQWRLAHCQLFILLTPNINIRIHHSTHYPSN